MGATVMKRLISKHLHASKSNMNSRLITFVEVLTSIDGSVIVGNNFVSRLPIFFRVFSTVLNIALAL